MSFSEMAASEPTDVDRQTVEAGVLATDTETAISAMASSLTMLTPLANATDDADAVYASVTPQNSPGPGRAAHPLRAARRGDCRHLAGHDDALRRDRRALLGRQPH